jgi:GNAT superfamily N-acetyltransferase
LAETRLRLVHASGDSHILKLAIAGIDDGIELHAQYESGSLGLPEGATVARWPVTFTPPAEYDEGHVWIGDGRIDIQVAELRGLGLGSLFMSFVVDWIKTKPDVPVAAIDLSIDDARTCTERDRRNRFYERLGFRFQYKGTREWGTSLPIRSHELLSPAPALREGWTLEEL